MTVSTSLKRVQLLILVAYSNDVNISDFVNKQNNIHEAFHNNNFTNNIVEKLWAYIRDKIKNINLIF